MPADTHAIDVKTVVRHILPAPLTGWLDLFAFSYRRRRLRLTHYLFAKLGYSIARRSDYYSVLPVLDEVEATRRRWDRASELPGITIDLEAMKDRLAILTTRWSAEYREATGSYVADKRQRFGPGYPELDARVLYYMLRETKPSAYLEVGSGLSTYYATLAARRNAKAGAPMSITCVEPYPFDALKRLADVELITAFVQDIPTARFEALEDGDVLFIDSSHALKIDSDVAYLFLEVVPRLKAGVTIHIHDVPFPFNTPFPANTWLFGERWPVYWNEAMVVQTFLAFNQAFEVTMSLPLIRHSDEAFLAAQFGHYVPVASDPDPPSSLWLRRLRSPTR